MSKFKKGDRVFCWEHGIGTVVQIHDPDKYTYTVSVDFDARDAYDSYTENGYLLTAEHSKRKPETVLMKVGGGDETV